MDIGHSLLALDLLWRVFEVGPAFQMAPPRLPGPPQATHWLLERPLTVGVALAALGALLFFVFARRTQVKQGAIAGGGVLALGVAMFVLGTVVTTDRERLIRGTEGFVRAVEEGDRDQAAALLSDRLTVRMGDTGSGLDRDWVLGAVELVGAGMEFERFGLGGMQATIDREGVGYTQFRVSTREARAGQSISWWKMEWRRDRDGEWRAYDLELLLMNGRRPAGGVAERLRMLAR